MKKLLILSVILSIFIFLPIATADENSIGYIYNNDINDTEAAGGGVVKRIIIMAVYVDILLSDGTELRARENDAWRAQMVSIAGISIIQKLPILIIANANGNPIGLKLQY